MKKCKSCSTYWVCKVYGGTCRSVRIQKLIENIKNRLQRNKRKEKYLYLDNQSKIIYNNNIYVIDDISIKKDYFKTDLIIRASDIIKLD
mgnify:CR=1 FL=1